MLSGVVRDFHGIDLKALRAFPNVVDPGDVWTLFIYHLHHLEDMKETLRIIIGWLSNFLKTGLEPDLSHLLVVVMSEVQVIWWVHFILTLVAAWK